MIIATALWGSPAAQGAPTWLVPSVYPAVDQTAPQVAFGGQGSAVAVWEDYTGTNQIIDSATHPAGLSWSSRAILTSAAQNAVGPQVAADGQGGAVAIWMVTDTSGRYTIQTATRPQGGDWGSSTVLSGSGGEPQITVNSRGDALAVWIGDGGIETATRPVGSDWSAPQAISDATGTSSHPQVAINARGDAVAVWSHRIGADEIVQAATRPLGVDWTPPTDVSHPGEGRLPAPQVVLDERGNAVTAWEATSGQNRIIEAATHPAGSGWSSPTSLSAPTQNAAGPQLALDAQGDATAIWSAADAVPVASGGVIGNVNGVIEVASRPATGGWSTPQEITSRLQNAVEPQLAVNGRGDAVAAWERLEGAGTSLSRFVVTAVRPAGGGWGPSQDRSTGSESPHHPQVAVDAQGDAVAIWGAQSMNGSSIVEVAGYDAAGPQLRNLQVSATGTVGAPLAFSVSPVDVWSSVKSTSWGFDGDGSRADGPSVSHTYPAAGTYVVAVTSTDSLDNATTERRTVVITDTPAGTGGGTGGGSDSVAPPAAPPPAGLPPAGLSSPLVSGDLAAALAAERLRATGLRSCLGRVSARAAAQRRQARLLSAGPRRIALRQITRRAQRGRGRCLLRFGRTPGRVSGLVARATGPGTIVLTFLAAGTDHALPPASRRYLVKQSLRPISTLADFRAARVLCSSSCRFPDAVRGERESLTITDLQPHRTYDYAVVARDNVSGRFGPRSETISIKTR